MSSPPASSNNSNSYPLSVGGMGISDGRASFQEPPQMLEAWQQIEGNFVDASEEGVSARLKFIELWNTTDHSQAKLLIQQLIRLKRHDHISEQLNFTLCPTEVDYLHQELNFQLQMQLPNGETLSVGEPKGLDVNTLDVELLNETIKQISKPKINDEFEWQVLPNQQSRRFFLVRTMDFFTVDEATIEAELVKLEVNPTQDTFYEVQRNLTQHCQREYKNNIFVTHQTLDCLGQPVDVVKFCLKLVSGVIDEYATVKETKKIPISSLAECKPPIRQYSPLLVNGMPSEVLTTWLKAEDVVMDLKLRSTFQFLVCTNNSASRQEYLENIQATFPENNKWQVSLDSSVLNPITGDMKTFQVSHSQWLTFKKMVPVEQFLTPLFSADLIEVTSQLIRDAKEESDLIHCLTYLLINCNDKKSGYFRLQDSPDRKHVSLLIHDESTQKWETVKTCQINSKFH